MVTSSVFYMKARSIASFCAEMAEMPLQTDNFPHCVPFSSRMDQARMRQPLAVILENTNLSGAPCFTQAWIGATTTRGALAKTSQSSVPGLADRLFGRCQSKPSYSIVNGAWSLKRCAL